MRQYFIYSGATHFVAAGLMFLALRTVFDKPAQSTIYSVDMIGSFTTAALEAPKSAPQPRNEPARAERRQRSDDIPLSPSVLKKRGPLPAPSVLSRQKLNKPDEAAAQPSSGGVSAEFPNFPYPWYITQVRAALWNEWSSRMPHNGRITSVIAFRILRDGAVKGAKTEKSSGNALFDFAALSSVEQAAPFPPLPSDYKESELAVHVEFRVAQ